MKWRAKIKYCGGCDPLHDRSDLAEQIKLRPKGAIEWVDSDCEIFDAVVVLQGCESACADLEAFQGYPIHHITCTEDSDRFIVTVHRGQD